MCCTPERAATPPSWRAWGRARCWGPWRWQWRADAYPCVPPPPRHRLPPLRPSLLSPPPPPRARRLRVQPRRRARDPQAGRVHEQVVVHPGLAMAAVTRGDVLVAPAIGVVHHALDGGGGDAEALDGEPPAPGLRGDDVDVQGVGAAASSACAPRPTSTARPCAAASAITRSVTATIVPPSFPAPRTPPP